MKYPITLLCLIALAFAPTHCDAQSTFTMSINQLLYGDETTEAITCGGVGIVSRFGPPPSAGGGGNNADTTSGGNGFNVGQPYYDHFDPFARDSAYSPIVFFLNSAQVEAFDKAVNEAELFIEMELWVLRGIFAIPGSVRILDPQAYDFAFNLNDSSETVGIFYLNFSYQSFDEQQ